MTGQRIIRPDTAFSISPAKGQKRPRIHDHAHLAFIRTLKCCICGSPNVEAAHIRSANALYGKRETGGGEKASDKWTVPMCREHHKEQHDAGNELLWWASKRIDPFGLALALHHASGDDEVAEAIIQSHKIEAAIVWNLDRAIKQVESLAHPPREPATEAVTEHHYRPSWMHMGDCDVCGHVQNSILHIGSDKHSAATSIPAPAERHPIRDLKQ